MATPITLVAVLAAATACATADPSAMPDRQTTSVANVGGLGAYGVGGGGWGTGNMSITTTNMDPAARTPVNATPDQAWAALHAVYTDLGIPVEAIDNANRLLGNLGFIRTRRMGDHRLSRFFDCGTNAFGSSMADTERLHLHVVSRVLTDDGVTRLQTDVRVTVLAGAASGTAANCRSIGTLERMVENRVRLAILR